MDRLDRVSIWAIVILIISSFALISGHMGEARPDRNVQKRTTFTENPGASGEADGKFKVVRNLMAAGNLGKAEMLAKELILKYPYEGEPHMMMGDILMRRQEPVRAMFEYKEAIDLNPDYLDKKTSLFQGKKLKIAVSEAMDVLEKRIKAAPRDDSLSNDKKIIYYLQRKIAGSCG
jgi:tetratricopeptide (TPR) repeat protein